MQLVRDQLALSVRVWDFRPRYQTLIVRQVGLNTCETVCIGKMIRRGHASLLQGTQTVNQGRGGKRDVEGNVVSVTVPSVPAKWMKHRNKCGTIEMCFSAHQR